MKKMIPVLLLLCSLNAPISAQTCTLVDSFDLNAPSVDTDHMMQADAIAFSNGYLWVSATNLYQRNFFLDTVYIYKYSTAGTRLDSIPYIMGSVNQIINNMAGDGTYLWALRFNTDTIYKISIASKSIIAAYSMGGRGTADLGYTMASIGDTLYFIGANTGKCFKYKKSTGVFVDCTNYAGHTGVYPSGLTGVGNMLVNTTYLDLTGASFDDVSLITPGSMLEGVTTRANWCIDIPDNLAYGAGYFWQIKSSFLFFDIRQNYVYQVQSSLSALATGVDEIANEEKFAISPNPAREAFTLSYPNISSWNSFRVNIYSATGVQVWSQQVNDAGGKAAIDISGASLAAGIYFVQLTNGMQQVMKKMSVY